MSCVFSRCLMILLNGFAHAANPFEAHGFVRPDLFRMLMFFLGLTLQQARRLRSRLCRAGKVRSCSLYRSRTSRSERRGSVFRDQALVQKRWMATLCHISCITNGRFIRIIPRLDWILIALANVNHELGLRVQSPALAVFFANASRLSWLYSMAKNLV